MYIQYKAVIHVVRWCDLRETMILNVASVVATSHEYWRQQYTYIQTSSAELHMDTGDNSTSSAELHMDTGDNSTYIQTSLPLKENITVCLSIQIKKLVFILDK
jgi:hypothetical protein